MELPKIIFICVLMFLMSREALCQNIDRKEAVHNTIEYQGKHMQKRDHQGFIPQILKLRQPITLSKQLTQTRPKTNQEVRNQMIPRQTLHDIPQALQQRSQTIQQRPINLRLNPATNLQRRVTNVTKYPVHNNNNTITQSAVPNNSPPEPPKDLEVKAAPPKQETVSAPVPNNPVIHILIPKETQADKSHKNPDFFEDEDDASDNTLTNHPEYLNKMPVKDLNKHESKVQYLDSMEVNKKPDKTLHNAEIRESSDQNDSKYDDETLTNKIKGRNKGKLNAMEDDRYAVDDEELFVQKSTKDDKITEKKAINKKPVPKTTNRTDKNKLKNSLKYSLTTNAAGDNIISVKGRNGENRNKDLNNEIKLNSTTRHPIQTVN